jgi:hypothetical protein
MLGFAARIAKLSFCGWTFLDVIDRTFQRVPEIDFQCFGDSEQRAKGRIPRPRLQRADERLAKASSRREHVSRNATTDSFLFEDTNKFSADFFSLAICRHTFIATRKLA